MKDIAKKYKEQGQVLIFAIVILIILLIATLFLFDLHSIIRSKIKLETAEQSAALAAAKWQGRSLNLIGDINLIKAVNGLLDDYDIYDKTYNINTIGTEDKKFESASKTLTEMQSRISFCGPLIAFGAAQQAAKNNGINIYEGDSKSGYKTVYNDMQAYLEKLDPGNNHPRYTAEAHYYKWRTPYINMLQLITDQGLAVRPSGDFAGIENVQPPWLYTPNDDSLYRAIINQMWCHYLLNEIVKYPDSFWDGKWYDIDFRQTSFSGESEIYTLGINFPNSQSDVEKSLDDIVGEGNWTIRPQIQWCTYDSKWKEGNRNYSGPNVENWHRGVRLRDNLKKSVRYGGAVAYAECYQRIKLMNRYRTKMKTPLGKDNPYAGQDQITKAQTALQNNIIEKTTEEPLKVGNDAATDGSVGGSVAKPLGALPDGSPPTDAIIVLPLFDKVALIPSSMQIFYPLRVNFTNVEKFIIWLSTVEDLHNPGIVPPGMQQYLAALQKLDDPTFRKIGWNNDYVRNDSDLSIYFNNDYKYDSVSNPKGAGWLQQIWVGTDLNHEDNGSKELEVQEGDWGTTRIYLGQKYLLKNRNGTLMINEQMICKGSPWKPDSEHSTNDGVPSY